LIGLVQDVIFNIESVGSSDEKTIRIPKSLKFLEESAFFEKYSILTIGKKALVLIIIPHQFWKIPNHPIMKWFLRVKIGITLT
jgi:hypothetical protein